MTAVDTGRRGRPVGRRRPPAARAPRPVWLAVVAASLPMFMATLDNLVMTSALPVVRADLGVDGRPAVVVRERLHADLRDLHAPGRHARATGSAGAG